jgi:predicted amidohydrolase YtcJ
MPFMISRRNALLASASALAAGALAAGGAAAQGSAQPSAQGSAQPSAQGSAQPADRIWSGGPILTMNDAAMRVEAVAERAGRIVAAGPAAEVMRLRGPQTRMIDLAGRTMIPGFVDPHGHIVLGGLQALSANILAPPDGAVTDIASLQKTLRDWAAANADVVRRVNLIIGFGYDNAQLKELRHPTRDDLDAVSKEVPVLLLHQSGHLGAMNSRALELAGVTADMADPPGGVIRRRAGSREPDGVLEETALLPALKLLQSVGLEGFKAFAKAGSELWARFGYTTAQEGRANVVMAQVIQAAAREGAFRNDVAIYVDVQGGTDFILANRSAAYVDRIRVAGGKLSTDGSPQGFTALRDRPYYKPVGAYPPGYQGYATIKPEEVVRLVDWAYQHGVHLLTHCNGEGASDLYIAALRAAEAKHGKADRRAVLIHGQFLREDQVDSYKELDVIPSLFPMHTFYWGDWHRDHTVGPAAADDISPTGWVRRRGMIFTTHHDAPVALPDSMRVLDATVTRRTRSGDILGPSQRVDVITGLKAMTIWPAYQQFEEASKGSIEVGKLADFAILSQDPTAIDPDDIDRIKIAQTIKEGQTIFELTQAEQRRGELMGPIQRADNGFQRFLNAASVYRDMARSASPFARTNPALIRAMAAAPHDPACVHRLLDELVSGVSL